MCFFTRSPKSAPLNFRGVRFVDSVAEAMGDSHHHRAGALKQQHKSHKTSQRSKGAVRRLAGPGRTCATSTQIKAGGLTGGKAVSFSNVLDHPSQARLQRAKQLRHKARSDVVEEKRRGKLASAAPLVTALIAMSECVFTLCH